MTALHCGNRFGRSLLLPGGVRFDFDLHRHKELSARLAAAVRDVTGAVSLMMQAPSVLARFEGTGIVSREICEDLGIVGPPARACGIDRDIRFSHPSGIYKYAHMPVSTWDTGDVLARAYVRWREIERSAQFVQFLLENLPEGPLFTPIGSLAPQSIVVTLVEGWRGEICHVTITGRNGEFLRYKIVDPSFHNWPSARYGVA